MYISVFATTKKMMMFMILCLCTFVATGAAIYNEKPCMEHKGRCMVTGRCGRGELTGKCPTQPRNIKCCTAYNEWQCSSRGGKCMWTEFCSSGRTSTGHCPTQTNGIKCCYPSGGGTTTTTTTTSKKRQAIAAQAYRRAHSKSRSRCGQYVREAVERALGVTLGRAGSAKDYGPSYTAVGFSLEQSYSWSESVNESHLKVGDVIILQNYGTHRHGHIEVFTGRSGKGRYCSDFKQKTPYPWSGHARIDVYRYQD